MRFCGYSSLSKLCDPLHKLETSAVIHRRWQFYTNFIRYLKSWLVN